MLGLVDKAVVGKALDHVIILHQPRRAGEEAIIEARAIQVAGVIRNIKLRGIVGGIIADVLSLHFPPVGKAISCSAVKEILSERLLTDHCLHPLQGASRKTVPERELEATRRDPMEKAVRAVVLIIVAGVSGKIEKADLVIERKHGVISEQVPEAQARSHRGDEV